MKHSTWLQTSLRIVASGALIACLGCPPPATEGDGDAGTSATSGQGDAATEAPPIEAQIEEAGIDTDALESQAEAEAETITAEDADAVLSDLESELAAEGE